MYTMMRASPMLKMIVAVYVMAVIIHKPVQAELTDKNDTVFAKVSAFQRNLIARKDELRFNSPKCSAMDNVAVEVEVSVFTVRSFEVDIYKQTIQFMLLICYEWKDPRLEWDIGIVPTNELLIRLYAVWNPSVIFTNAIESRKVLGLPGKLTRRGIVSDCNAYEVTIPCSFDLQNFPNDVHNCTVQMASSRYSAEEVSLVNGLPFEMEIVLTSEWTFRIWQQTRSELLGSRGNVSTIDLMIEVTRRSSLYGVRVFFGLWMSVILFMLTIMMSANYQQPLSCLALVAASMQHGYLSTLVKGATTTPRLYVVSSIVTVACLYAVCSAHLRLGLRYRFDSAKFESVKKFAELFERTILALFAFILVVALLAS